MNKLFVFLLLVSLLNICFQLDCSSLTDSSCSGFNSPYKLKCHKFSTSIKCQEIQVDDGCHFDSNDNCVQENDVTLPDDEKCFMYELNQCRRIKDKCTSYKDYSCGGHAGIEDLTQCIKLANLEYCCYWYR